MFRNQKFIFIFLIFLFGFLYVMPNLSVNKVLALTCGVDVTCGVVKGVVKYTDGTNANGVQVYIVAGQTWACTTVDGTCTFDAPQGAQDVWIQTPDGSSCSSPSSCTVPVSVSISLVTANFTITRPVGRVTGTITYSDNSGGVSGATVAMTGKPNATTDASGNYTFAGVNTGSQSVTLSSVPTNTRSADDRTTKTVSVSGGVINTGPTFYVAKVGKVSGTVTGNGGAAVSGARVFVRTVTNSISKDWQNNTNSGQYSFDAPIGDQEVYLDTVGLPTGATITSTNPVVKTITQGGSHTANFTIQTLGTINGTVKYPDESVAVEVTVRIAPGGTARTTTTNENGEYQFTEVPTGNQTVYLNSYPANVAAASNTTSVQVNVNGGTENNAPDLFVTETGTIRGQVVTQAGNDILGTRVYVQTSFGSGKTWQTGSSDTNSSGSYSFTAPTGVQDVYLDPLSLPPGGVVSSANPFRTSSLSQGGSVTANFTISSHGGLTADIEYYSGDTSGNPRGWYITLTNDGSLYAGGENVTLNFGTAWCSLNYDQYCNFEGSDNGPDFRGVGMNRDLTVTVPAARSSSYITPNTHSFLAVNNPIFCGTIQGDVFYKVAGLDDEIIGGIVFRFGASCPGSAILTPNFSSCSLTANWNVGYNEVPRCNIRIQAGTTDYRISSNCNSNGNINLSGNISTPQGTLSIHDTGIYRLDAGVTASNQATLTCTTTGTSITASPLIITKTTDGWPQLTLTVTSNDVTAWHIWYKNLTTCTGCADNIGWNNTGITINDTSGNPKNYLWTPPNSLATGDYIFRVSDNNPSPNPLATSNSVRFKLVEVSGWLYYVDASGANAGPVTSGTVATGTTPSSANINSNGSFSFLVPKGTSFRIDGPDLTNYTKTAVNSRLSPKPSSYEWQVAGIDCTDNSSCNSNQQAQDLSSNSDYNISYKPTAPDVIPPPTVTTDPADPVGNTTANLKSRINPNGSATTSWFRYSTSDPGPCDDNFGTRIPGTGGNDKGAGTTNVTDSQPITGLTAGATYYFCAIAQNSSPDKGFGAVVPFTTTIPDLIVQSGSVSLNTGTLSPGTDVTFKGTVQNSGTGVAGGTFNNRFEIDTSSTTFSTADVTLTPHPTITALAAGSTSSVTSDTWTIPACSGTCQHTVRLWADQPSPSVTELDEDNNYSISTFTITSTAQPDLIVDNLSPTTAITGSPVSFSGRVRNQGTGAAGVSSTRLRYDSNRDGTLDTTSTNQSTGSLAAGATETETWPAVTFSTAGNYLFEICADTPADAIAESNNTNNCTTATLVVSSPSSPSPSPTVSPSPTPGTTYTVQGFVFIDTNSNAIKDSTESCYNGLVTVNLSGATSIYTQDIACINQYSFSGLAADSYTMTITPVTGHTSTNSPIWTQSVTFP